MNQKQKSKRGSAWIWILIILIIVAVGVGIFLLLNKCPNGELFDPYNDMCVSKNVICNLENECLLLEGQTALIDNNKLIFTLISASEGEIGVGDDDNAIIEITGKGRIYLENKNEKSSVTFSDYVITLEASDGDKDKIMGANFEVGKLE